MMESSLGTTQLKGMSFVKMGTTNNFQEYVENHIKRKVNKEEPQSVEEQLEQIQPQSVDPKFRAPSKQTQGEQG